MYNLKDEGPIVHFNKKLRRKEGGYILTRDNYCRVSNKNSFGGDPYSDVWCEKQLERCMINFDLNISYFKTLDRDLFIDDFDFYVRRHRDFDEVHDLNLVKGLSACYIMVLDGYCQLYVGVTGDVCARIQAHWSKTKEFDRLIYGDVGSSKLSIDSFRALDTTRIFINTKVGLDLEDKIINKFKGCFIANRISGGVIDGGLQQVSTDMNIFKGRDLYEK